MLDLMPPYRRGTATAAFRPPSRPIAIAGHVTGWLGQEAGLWATRRTRQTRIVLPGVQVQ